MSERSVSTDALETLGKIHIRQERRDAIHLAVIPAEAGRTLRPGAHVTLVEEKAFAADSNDGIGIVDPFLRAPVFQGERFWLVIYPRKITSLRHVWSHPDIPEEKPLTAYGDDSDIASEARAAVHELAVNLGISDEAMMEGAKKWLGSGGDYEGYMHFGVDLDYGWDMEKFWDAYTLLTGETVPDGKRTSFFSCSC